MSFVEQVRSFNRFYTREIGLLSEHLPASDLTLAEARVLYELAQTAELTAATIARTLGMDKAHVSRIVARFRRGGLLRSRISPEHGKQKLLSLTARGRKAFTELNRGTQTQIEEVLSPLTQEDRQRLVAGMGEIQALLHPGRQPGRQPGKAPAESVHLRSLRVGDLGWIIHRQAVLYYREYGWDWTYEGLVSKILGEFAANYDPRREDAWVAEAGGRVAGSVFLMKSGDAGIAKLRLLYVEPWARGLGIGSRLVNTCVERARSLGYRELTLWTNDVLVSARRIYEAAGFSLSKEERHHAFGHDLVGQTWTLRLESKSN